MTPSVESTFLDRCGWRNGSCSIHWYNYHWFTVKCSGNLYPRWDSTRTYLNCGETASESFRRGETGDRTIVCNSFRHLSSSHPQATARTTRQRGQSYRVRRFVVSAIFCRALSACVWLFFVIRFVVASCFLSNFKVENNFARVTHSVETILFVFSPRSGPMLQLRLLL